MDLLALVPARGGSKGVPRKNIRSLGGKPLLAWTIETALACEDVFADVLVSTDDEEIAAVARAHGAAVPYLRSAAAASDAAKSIDVVREVLRRQAERGRTYDAVCLLQPTTPFRSEALLRACLDRYAEGDVDSLISVTRVPDHYHPNWAFVAGNDARLTPAQGPGSVIPRRQELPPAFIRDGAVYLTATDVLLAGSFFGEQLGYVENADSLRVNIDTPADWAKAEDLAKKHTGE